ncbi:hypothetical protein K1T71_005766 [Dendrolimus kikuchii]|uniref:Uncharacterized protein n=1 Tax=Dendrolimus kikuchii TaxID=765133 RepID=A0ACC1D553_9NEOP|nr:hypothetical protein K1T71_005766 [Dendrolimus kikuchii]
MAWKFCAVVLLATLASSFVEAGPVIDSLPIPEDCTGNFCTTKPKGYDQLQSEIDKSIMDLKLHYKMEDRQGPEIHLGTYGSDDNCRYEVNTIKPYIVKLGSKPVVIAQSSLLDQTFNTTTCKHSEVTSHPNSKECFFDYDQTQATRCKETFTKVNIHSYNIAKKTIENIELKVSVWCSCHVLI